MNSNGTKEVIKSMWKYINKKYIIIFFIIGILGIVFNTLEPFFAKQLINECLYTQHNKLMIKYGLIWLTLFFVQRIIYYLKDYFNLKFNISTYKNIRYAIFKKITNVHISYFEKNSIGYCMSRQIDDVDGLDGLMPNVLVEGFLSFFQFIIICYISFKINILLTVISIILYIGNILFNFSFPLKKLYKNHNEAKAEVSKELQDVISGIKLVKSSSAEKFEQKRYWKILNKYFKTKEKRDIYNIIRRNGQNFMNGLSTPLLYTIGGFFIASGNMSIGDLLAFMMYYSRMLSALGPLTTLIPRLKISLSYSERIDETLNLKDENNNKYNILHNLNNCKIQFKNVCFSYDGTNDILKNINFEILPGQKVAFVGNSGAGKSTIAKLIMGFYKVTKGKILINDMDISDMNLDLLRFNIGYIPQNSYLFHRTLRENIVYLKDDQVNNDDYIYKILEQCMAKSFVMDMPNKLDTVLGDRGNTISGGQKQRLCLSREIFKNPKIMIFDEATSALDSISERNVQKAIDNIIKDKTSLTITHKISTIINSDIIYVLNKGEIVEKGTHKSLIDKQGIYNNYYESQNIK